MAELAIERLTDAGIASVILRRGKTPADVAAATGANMPDGPRWTAAGGTTIIGTGPGRWLAYANIASTVCPPAEWVDRLADRLCGIAAVADQSGAYVIFEIGGPAARSLLQRGASIDLHSDSFAPGSAAITAIAHIGVTIWQVDPSPTCRVALFRSFETSFRRWLDLTAATL